MALSDNLPSSASPRAARSIQRILDAARRLFGREGYQGASMTEVARAAGVSKGLLHYHFRSKEHLLIEAQRATFRQIHRRFEERFQKGDLGMETALEALDAMWEALFDMRKWAPFMVETLSLSAHPGPVRQHLDEFYAESNAFLERGIHQVFASDIDTLSIPPDRLARVVRTALHGLVVEMAHARSEADMEPIEETYRDLRDLFSEVALATPGSEPAA
ncbi:MAG: TetR/AcrR family transcriptional regulator [Deltaproteobacteria bacterium]|nr:TetR/AcrR family transcriptional regulator [Deltaproteobacteria bacterium]